MYFLELAAKLHGQLLRRHKTLSSDLNSVLEFADDTITKNEGDNLIKLLEMIKLYPHAIDANDISYRIIDEVFLNPMDRAIKTRKFRMFVEGLNTYLSKKYQNGQAISIPDPPQDRRRMEPSFLRNDLSFTFNNAFTFKPLDEPSNTSNDKLVTIQTVDRIINSNNNDSNNYERHVRLRRMKPANDEREIITNEPVYDRHRSTYNENNAKGKQFLRRLKEESFKKNIEIKTKATNKEKNKETNDTFKLKRRLSNPKNRDKMDMDLFNDFEVPTTASPHAFLGTTKRTQIKPYDILSEIEMNNGKDVPDFFKAFSGPNSPPFFPPEMFIPPSKSAKKKTDLQHHNYNPLKLNPKNFSPFHLNPTNNNPVDMHPNNFNPLDIHPNSFHGADPPGLLDALRNLPHKVPDPSDKTVAVVIPTDPSESMFDMVTIDVKQRNDEDFTSTDIKGIVI